MTDRSFTTMTALAVCAWLGFAPPAQALPNQAAAPVAASDPSL